MRNRQIAAYVAFGGITAAGVALAATSFPLLIPFYLALGGRFVGTVRAVKRVNEASVALSNGDAVAGRALAEPVTRAWWAPGRVRALAELRVAIADALDGNGEQALDRVRRARAQAVAAPHPAPVLVLHGDQPAHRARPHEGSAQPARVARPDADRRGAQAVALDRADAPVGRRERAEPVATCRSGSGEEGLEIDEASSTIACARASR